MNVISIRLTVERDIIAARQAARDIARDLGLGLADQTRLATAVSELTRNVIQHAGEGVCVISSESNRTESRIQVTVEDQGPGIPDIKKALTEGFSTARGLGAGLPGARRLVDELSIESRPGHTSITITMVRRLQ